MKNLKKIAALKAELEAIETARQYMLTLNKNYFNSDAYVFASKRMNKLTDRLINEFGVDATELMLWMATLLNDRKER